MLRMELKNRIHGVYHRYVYFPVNNPIEEFNKREPPLSETIHIKIDPLTAEALLSGIPGKQDRHIELDILPARCRQVQPLHLVCAGDTKASSNAPCGPMTIFCRSKWISGKDVSSCV